MTEISSPTFCEIKITVEVSVHNEHLYETKACCKLIGQINKYLCLFLLKTCVPGGVQNRQSYQVRAVLRAQVNLDRAPWRLRRDRFEAWVLNVCSCS